jgi:hypothetical protein
MNENLSSTLAELARERGYQAMAARDLGLLNAKNWKLLQAVQENDRIIVWVVSRIWWKLLGGVLRASEGSASQAARSSVIGSMG